MIGIYYGLCAGILFVLITLAIAAVDFALRDLFRRWRGADEPYPSEVTDEDAR